MVVEPSVAGRARGLARLRALGEISELDVEDLKRQLKKMRERALRESGWLLEDFSRAAKGRGFKVLLARDGLSAVRYIQRSARGTRHLLVNRSATVRELAPLLEREGFSIVDTYSAEEASGGGDAGPWREWQLGEPEPRTAWESFTPSPPAGFTGRPLPVPEGRWAAVVGLSAASARDGTLFFVQHTHNISKLLSSAGKLFVVAGIEKLVPRQEDAVLQSRAAALFGLPAVLEDALKDERAAARGAEERGAGAEGEPGAGQTAGGQAAGGPAEVLFEPRTPGEVHVIILDCGRRSLLRSRNKQALQCIGCKACRRGCSMGRLGAATPRDAALAGLAGSPTETEGRGLYECTMCRACSASCPLGIPTHEYNLALRRKLAIKGGLPEVFRLQSESILGKGNPFGEPPSGRGQFHPGPRPRKGAPVLLYLGCVASFQRPKVVDSAFRLMDAAGTDFSVLGDDESCCGYPLYAAGSRRFEDAARKNLEAIRASGARTVVTTCAGCCKTLREIYPEHFNAVPEVLHLVEFISALASGGKLGFPGEVKLRTAYHDPCDLGRALGIYEPPRDLLSRIPGLEPVEFHFNRQSSRCCGAGGGAKGYDGRASEEHAFRRMLEAVDAGAEAVTSACPACLANLQVVIPRVKRDTGRALRFLDISEVAARALERP